MRKTFLNLAIIMFIASSISTAYTQAPDKKSEKARENLQEKQKDVVEAKQDLKEAQKDSVTEYQKFKKEQEVRIADHQKSITEFKARIAKEKKKNRAEYEKKIAALEQKNTDLRKNLDDYKEAGKDKWDSFTKKFNHDMDALGKSLKDFTVNDKKKE